MKFLRTFIICLLFLAAPAFAEKSGMSIELSVEKFVLDNGLTVLFHEDHRVPVFTGYIMAKTGSVNEDLGMTGVSHLLEHMMFKGTKSFGTLDYEREKPVLDEIDVLAEEMRDEQMKLRSAYLGGSEDKVKELRARIAELEESLEPLAVHNELWRIYQRHGGTSLNATTNKDCTQYFVKLPANRFELWAYLESDRLADPVFREFYAERDVVREERRMRIESNPGGILRENFDLAVNAGGAYAAAIIGRPDDIETMSRVEVEQYFRRYYAPNNLIMVLMGDLKPEQVKETVNRYFGSLKPAPAPRQRCAAPLAQNGERRIQVIENSSPFLMIGYPGPVPGHNDQFVLDVLGSILCEGRTSRFQRNIIDKGIALRASAGVSNHSLGNTFIITAAPQDKHSYDEVEQAIYKELADLAENGPEDWELEKVVNELDLSLVNFFKYTVGLAGSLAKAEAFYGGWRNFDERDKYHKVTGEDIKRVIGEYLTPERRTVAFSVKPEGGVK
ncbi:MAG: insulinase family protein [bacterium]|nr:insulinase family protein [bacterium]